MRVPASSIRRARDFLRDAGSLARTRRGSVDEVHTGRFPLFRCVGVRGAAQGWRRVRRRRRAGSRRPAGAGGEVRRSAGSRARKPEDRAGRGNSREHRSHRRGAHACACEQRGARADAPRRHRLPSVAAAAASRHRGGRVDDPRGRSDRRRKRLSPRRRLGCGRGRGAGLVFRRQGRDRRASCGSARWRRWG